MAVWQGEVLQHLAHEGEGFAHKHAVVGVRGLQGFVVLQFRFRIAWKSHATLTLLAKQDLAPLATI